MPLWLAWSDPPLDQTPIYSPPTSRPPCIQITAPCTYAPQPRRYCRSQSGNRHHGLQQTCSVPGKHKMRYSQNERYYAYTWPLDPATPCFLFSSVLSYGTRPLIIQITVPSNYRASRLTCLPNYPSCAAHPFQDYHGRDYNRSCNRDAEDRASQITRAAPLTLFKITSAAPFSRTHLGAPTPPSPTPFPCSRPTRRGGNQPPWRWRHPANLAACLRVSNDEHRRAKRWTALLFFSFALQSPRNCSSCVHYQLRNATGIAASARWHFRSYV